MEDQIQGGAIEAILTRGIVDLGSVAGLDSIRARLDPFERLELLEREGHVLQSAADVLPYARTIASVLDSYRQTATGRFSSAI
ncbi:hypothetical protein [Sphingomonas sp. Leaf38]|uniref:hypothetical protein n=1 Tax=Sphingomonas sp. Leaf38 TaxID=1736217 RepID=UPI0006FC5520|nr:hypothetical protein [Sphingomonas sp. Leaf38]KQN28822.1 hypothetical protein ASE88_07335 [Sphingomonas sp. Leaf38]